MASFLSENGISHLLTPPHTPEHNGFAERRHRHIVETGLTLLRHASLPLKLWVHAFQCAVYLINRQPTTTLQGRSPFQVLLRGNPNYKKLKIFGCLCFPWLTPYNNSKLDPKSKPCVFIGYCTQQSAYKCLDPQTSRVYITRHVIFDETIFPLATSQTASHIPLYVQNWLSNISGDKTMVQYTSPSTDLETTPSGS